MRTFAFISASFFATIVFCSIPSFGQKRTAEQLIQQKNIPISQYEFSESELQSFSIEMSFGSTEIISKLTKLKDIGATIHRVDMVYTDFPKGCDLTNLNFNRIKEIEKIHPILVQNMLIPWKIIRQTGCKTEEEARTYFHGIIVYFQENASSGFVKEVNTNLNNYLPKNITKELARKIMDTIKKPTVKEVFKRQKNWNNAVLIVDLTTSMIPYNSQVILWQLLNSERGFFKEVVMFNDGDSAPEKSKKVGKTGGIYHEKNISFEALRKTSFEVCQNGIGNSDFPENDLEAVLFAIEKNPNAGEYILIADNDAPPRDMSLLNKISRPIRIVLCDTESGILPEYLEIARRTAGSVHTITDDILDLMKRKEGEVFFVGNRRFKISSGRIRLF